MRRSIAFALVMLCSCQTWQPVSSWNPGDRLPAQPSEVRVHFKGDSTVLLRDPIFGPDSVLGYQKGGGRVAYPTAAIAGISTKQVSAGRTVLGSFGVFALIGLAGLLYALHAVAGSG